jgi:hypothetical protein
VCGSFLGDHVSASRLAFGIARHGRPFTIEAIDDWADDVDEP